MLPTTYLHTRWNLKSAIALYENNVGIFSGMHYFILRIHASI